MTAIDASHLPEGSASAWTEATRGHDRWLRTVVTARLGENQAIDDVMQEIYLAAATQRTPFHEVRQVGAWLYRLAVRQSLLYRRKRGRQAKLADRHARREPAPDTAAADPLAWLLADERRRMVREALAALPGRDAEVLLLKYTENWSYRELAEHLGQSESAIESRLHRARAKLREALAARGESE